VQIRWLRCSLLCSPWRAGSRIDQCESLPQRCSMVLSFSEIGIPLKTPPRLEWLLAEQCLDFAI